MATIDIRKPLKNLLPKLIEAHQANLNEADTVSRIMHVFSEILGYDPLDEITREMSIKDKYVDIAIKINGIVSLLIEVKAAGIALRDKHLEQAKHYAAEANIPWVLLTNGTEWTLYHLTFDEGINYDRAFHVNLLETPLEECASMLAVLHRKSVISDGLEDFWEHRVALSPESIGKVLFFEDTLTMMRRELKKLIGVRVEEDDLGHAIHSMLSVETREHIGPMKIRRRRKTSSKPSKDVIGAAGANIAPVIESKTIESEK